MAQPEPENVPGFFDRRRASVPDGDPNDRRTSKSGRHPRGGQGRRVRHAHGRPDRRGVPIRRWEDRLALAHPGQARRGVVPRPGPVEPCPGQAVGLRRSPTPSVPRWRRSARRPAPLRRAVLGKRRLRVPRRDAAKRVSQRRGILHARSRPCRDRTRADIRRRPPAAPVIGPPSACASGRHQISRAERRKAARSPRDRQAIEIHGLRT